MRVWYDDTCKYSGVAKTYWGGCIIIIAGRNDADDGVRVVYVNTTKYAGRRSTVMQVARLAAFTLLDANKDVLMTSDADLWPIDGMSKMQMVEEWGSDGDFYLKQQKALSSDFVAISCIIMAAYVYGNVWIREKRVV